MQVCNDAFCCMEILNSFCSLSRAIFMHGHTSVQMVHRRKKVRILTISLFLSLSLSLSKLVFSLHMYALPHHTCICYSLCLLTFEINTYLWWKLVDSLIHKCTAKWAIPLVRKICCLMFDMFCMLCFIRMMSGC